MPRLFAIALILAEVNFRCVPTTACEDDDEQRCMEKQAETEGETEGETGGETETGSEGEPMPDLGG